MKGITITMKKELSSAETLIMKAVWDHPEDPALPDLTDYLRTEYGKEYARTSMVTFLVRLANKGFVETYRKGRLSYVHALISEDEYRAEVAKRDTGFWFRGEPVGFLSALHRSGGLSREDVRRIEEYLNELRERDELDHKN